MRRRRLRPDSEGAADGVQLPDDLGVDLFGEYSLGGLLAAGIVRNRPLFGTTYRPLEIQSGQRVAEAIGVERLGRTAFWRKEDA